MLALTCQVPFSGMNPLRRLHNGGMTRKRIDRVGSNQTRREKHEDT